MKLRIQAMGSKRKIQGYVPNDWEEREELFWTSAVVDEGGCKWREKKTQVLFLYSIINWNIGENYDSLITDNVANVCLKVKTDRLKNQQSCFPFANCVCVTGGWTASNFSIQTISPPPQPASLLLSIWMQIASGISAWIPYCPLRVAILDEPSDVCISNTTFHTFVSGW